MIATMESSSVASAGDAASRNIYIYGEQNIVLVFVPLVDSDK